MTQTIVHFIFALSEADCLVHALRQAGRDDPVVVTSHDFNVGPIDPSDPSARTKWLEAELGRTPDRQDPRMSNWNWDESRFPGHRKVAWFTRRSAVEYAGFLDWLWHRGDTPCDVVDLSEVKLSRPHKPDPPEPPPSPRCLLIHHDIIAHNKLWDLAEPLPTTERLRYRELWGQLLSENAPLRVIEGDKLVSAPISFFDERLMSFVTDEWQKVMMIFSWTSISYWDEGVDQIDDTFLAARMRILVENGRVEIRGDTARGIEFGEARLAR
jgi:hypothetical protein